MNVNESTRPTVPESIPLESARLWLAPLILGTLMLTLVYMWTRQERVMDMSNPMIHRDPPTTQPTWPASSPGRAAMVGATLAAIFIVLVLFALPMIGEVLGMELVPGILNTWLSPLIVLALTWVVAVLSLIAWRRGDRSVVGQVILILSLAGGTLLALDAVLEAIAGR